MLHTIGTIEKPRMSNSVGDNRRYQKRDSRSLRVMPLRRLTVGEAPTVVCAVEVRLIIRSYQNPVLSTGAINRRFIPSAGCTQFDLFVTPSRHQLHWMGD